MRLLGPVLGRLQAEYLQPLINRCFNILSRSKKLPVPPEFMAKLDIEIEYVSPIAKAQRSGDVQSIVRMLEMMQPLMALDPTIMDWIDMDGLAKHAEGAGKAAPAMKALNDMAEGGEIPAGAEVIPGPGAA